MRYLGIPLNHEEVHFLLTKALRSNAELLKNPKLYDKVHDIMAYFSTLEDMAGVTEYSRNSTTLSAKAKELLDFEATGSTKIIEGLLQTATGMTPADMNAMRAEILAVNKNPDDEFTSQVLLKLIAAIKKAETRLDGMAAQSRLVGVPLEQVMKYDDKFAVALGIADEKFAARCEAVIKRYGYQNVVMVDTNGKVMWQGQSQQIGTLVGRFKGRTVVAMSDVIGSVADLAGKQQVLAMLLDKDMIEKLKQSGSDEKLREVLETLRILAMSLDPKTLAYLQNTGGGAGAPGSAFQFPTVSAVFDNVRQSFLSESLAGRAA